MLNWEEGDWLDGFGLTRRIGKMMRILTES